VTGPWSSPAEQLATSLDRLVAAVNRERAALAALRGDLTATSLLALSHLRGHGPLSPGALSDALLMSPGGTTAVIRRLVAAGLVVREAGPGNQHGVRLSITREGVALGAIAVDANALEGEPIDILALIDAIVAAAEQRAAHLAQAVAQEFHADATADVPALIRWG
jgi:DNA-binding MarR family transcriptional regulator